MKVPNTTEYPKTLRIGNVTYRVVFRNRIDNTDPLGMCHSIKKIIYLKKGLSLVSTFSTLIHEVLHALEFEYNIEIKHKSIHQYEQAILDFLMNNQ
jgi:hypothetical protein